MLAKTSTIKSIKRWLGAGAINIFGRPFAGKDTQARALASLLNASVIAGGEILRGHHDQTTIKRLMARGTLFPTDFYLSVILPHLARPDYAGRPLVLSSVGRLSGEEKTVLRAARAAGHPIKAALLLKLPESEVRRRYALARRRQDRGQRLDDAEHLLDVRLDEFRAKTRPVISHYRERGLLVEVDGSPEPDKVTALIIEALFELATGPARRD